MKNDLHSPEDIALMVDTFYERVFQDSLLAPFFKHIDYPEHRVKMISFWNFSVLDIPGYTTQVFEKHVHMPLNDAHFERWKSLFIDTVRDLFEGERADRAIQRATVLSWTFSSHMKEIQQNQN